MTIDEKIQLIGQKILILSNHLDKYKVELEKLQNELSILKQERQSASYFNPPIKEITKEDSPVVKIKEEIKPEPFVEQKITEPVLQEQSQPKKPLEQTQKTTSISFEERVGARWFSIIGIVTLVLGIAIGVKYAIDKDLINETTRLVLGYLSGAIILSLALVYKKKYDVFSAVLLSGAMAVMYFTTYVGYSHYHFYTAPVAFAIMAVFTGFTVFAAHVYNYEIIALIGLVGGYSVPMLLSTGSGEIEYLFGFMLILNLGILVLSFKKYWKFVNHVAYALTWLIFSIWMLSSYKPEVYFGRTLFFATAFYLIFYTSFIAYKIFRSKEFSSWDVVLVLTNSLIYFGLGYNAMNNQYYEKHQGLFCVLNALFHLGFAVLCKKKEMADKTIFHFIIAMVISFITMAIPIQLEGDHVTIIWICEMLVLFWMAQKFNQKTYKNLAYGITLLAFFSLIHDWARYYYYCNNYDLVRLFTPLFNHYFLTSILASAGFSAAWVLHRKYNDGDLAKFVNVSLVIISGVVLYMTFANEISLYFNIRYSYSQKQMIGSYGNSWLAYDYSWNNYKILWMIIYTNVFVSLTGIINLAKVKSKVLTYVFWPLTLFMVFISFTAGFLVLSELIDTALSDYPSSEVITTWNYNFRYVFLPFTLLLLYMVYQYRNSEALQKVKAVNTWLFHVFVLIVLSNELTHIMVMTHLDKHHYYEKVSYRMGYTVLWGLYSMALIVYGIIKKRKTLRIIAISLFALTLLKLILDAMSMTLGYRLIVFIIIGIIMLVVSFMYQKFKPILFGDENDTSKN